MATTLRGALRVQLSTLLQDALDLSSPEDRLDWFEKWVIADGEGADQAEEVWHDTRTVAGSATDSLDLAGGGLLNALGQAVTFTRVKAIILKAAAANPNTLEVTQSASGIPFLKANTDAILLGAGDLLVLTRRGATGIAVGAGATDDLAIVNPAAGSCTYTVILIGTK